MCTIGALRLGHNDYLLFKNKDFVRDHFEDQLVLSRNVFGISGVATWDHDGTHRDLFSGFSVGANRYGLLCCDANVGSDPVDGLNYDLLTEVALNEGTDIESAIYAVEKAVSRDAYWRANLVMIDSKMSAAIEVYGTKIRVECDEHRMTRTNHHLILQSSNDAEDLITTVSRLSSSRKRLSDASSVEDIQQLQASHDDQETGICNHEAYQTVYSYIMRVRSGKLTLMVKQGRPCEVQSYSHCVPPLGEAWSKDADTSFRASYPSGRSNFIL